MSTTLPETTPTASLPPKTFGDQKMKVAFSPTVPEDLDAATATFLNGALEASCRLVKDGTSFRFTGSETITEAAICEPAGAQAAGRDNYEATASIFRFWDPANPGTADAAGDALFSALRVKGSPGVFFIRYTSKRWDEPWAAGDEYQAFVVTSDNWSMPDNPHEGYMKATVPLFVSNAEANGVVAA